MKFQMPNYKFSVFFATKFIAKYSSRKTSRGFNIYRTQPYQRFRGIYFLRNFPDSVMSLQLNGTSISVVQIPNILVLSFSFRNLNLRSRYYSQIWNYFISYTMKPEVHVNNIYKLQCLSHRKHARVHFEGSPVSDMFRKRSPLAPIIIRKMHVNIYFGPNAEFFLIY
jgi:hypothetical protein